MYHPGCRFENFRENSVVTYDILCLIIPSLKVEENETRRILNVEYP